MSRENIALVRRITALFNEQEIDQALNEVADDFEMDWSNSIGPLRGVYSGRRELLELWSSFTDAWESVRWDPEEIIEVDASRVIVVNRVRMRGRSSGAGVDATGVQLWTISAGTVQRIKLFQSTAEALKFAGEPEAYG